MYTITIEVDNGGNSYSTHRAIVDVDTTYLQQTPMTALRDMIHRLDINEAHIISIDMRPHP